MKVSQCKSNQLQGSGIDAKKWLQVFMQMLSGTGNDIKHTCSICGKTYVGWGNNADPVNDGRCCNECNAKHVIPARKEMMMKYPGWQRKAKEFPEDFYTLLARMK